MTEALPPVPLTPHTIGYLRVSSREQSIDRQMIGLRDLCDELHVEKVSAVAAARPVFESVLERLCPDDTLLVWDLDHAFRSTVDAVMTAEALRARGVHFRIVSLNIDTSTAEGELYLTLMAAFATFERRILSRRTIEGLDAARLRGVSLGRPRKLDDETVHEAYRQVTNDGYPSAYVAALLNVSRPTLQRAFRRCGLENTNGALAV